MSALPGIGPVVWEALYRMGQAVKLDSSEPVTIVAINPVGGDAAKYTVQHPDGRTEENIEERRLS